jgi:hypothetical protein
MLSTFRYPTIAYQTFAFTDFILVWPMKVPREATMKLKVGVCYASRVGKYREGQRSSLPNFNS